MTTSQVTLRRADLYPTPPRDSPLLVRRHRRVTPFDDGCEDGDPAAHKCVAVVAAGTPVRLPPVGGSIYEPLENGAYFLGELSKFVHVPPSDFRACMWVVMDPAVFVSAS